MTEIPPLPDSDVSRADGINETGMVLARSDFEGSGHYPFIWDDGEVTELGSLGGSLTVGRGINSSGHACGSGRLADDETTHGFFWNGKELMDLGGLGPDGSQAFGLNDFDHVVGSSWLVSTQPFFWDASTGMVPLPVAGAEGGRAYEINNAGTIVGNVYYSDPPITRAVTWQNGAVVELEGLPGARFSAASDINEDGMIVGYSIATSGYDHAVLWEDQEIELIGVLPGDASAVARAINSAEVVVGTSLSASLDARAFVFEREYGMVDLAELVPAVPSWEFSAAYDVNDAGQIVGSGYREDLRRGYVLTPILEGVDCNGNGRPDACDVAIGLGEDCNGNGKLDECDIADGTSEDCNRNGVPDECDIAEGTSEDVNGNGVPDECEPCVPADVDGDGGIGLSDLLIVLAQWGPCPPTCIGDVDGDDTVGLTDLLTVLSHWGPCP